MTDTTHTDPIDELFAEFEESGPPFASQQSKAQYEGLRDYFKPVIAALVRQAEERGALATADRLEHAINSSRNEYDMRDAWKRERDYIKRAMETPKNPMSTTMHLREPIAEEKEPA